jgi:hypothetical protein
MSNRLNSQWVLSINVVMTIVIAVLPGCDFFSGPGPVKASSGVEHPPIVIVDKDIGKSLIMFDVQFENEKLTELETTLREVYLAKRAFAMLDHKKMANPQHKSMERCVIKIVMLTSVDQYQKPIWGSALKIADLEIDLGKFRKSGKMAADFQDSEIGEFFVSKQFYHENVKCQPMTLVTIK